MGNTASTGTETDETTETETETDTTSTESETTDTTEQTGETETDSTDTDTDSTETDTATGDVESRLTAAKKHSATWEKRAKENKTALDAALAENATLKTQVEGFEKGKTLATQRVAIAKAHGVPESALRGDDEASLTEHAKSLQQFFPTTSDGHGLGNAGDSVHGDGDRSAKDIVNAATSR